MKSNPGFRLKDGSASLKVVVTCFVAALSIGYFVSLLQVNNRASFDLAKTALHFRGAPSDASGIFVPQSNTTMISVAHVHTFSQPVIIGLMGLLLVGTGLSERAKIFWILVSFFGSLAMNASPWLIRDLSPRFAYLLHAAGMTMIGSFLVMALAILYEVWGGRDA